MNKQLETVLVEIDVLRERLCSLRPLPEESLSKIRSALSLENTYESNRIEGNTLTLQETYLVVSEGITIGGRSVREHLEALNHAEAIEYIRELSGVDLLITERVICEIHGLILRGIDRMNAGVYRRLPVMIGGSAHVPPQPYLLSPQMESFILRYREMESSGVHAVIIAAYLHYELVRIHPFIDGNGRTARLLMNLYLLSRGYPLVTLKGDGESRRSYYAALEDSHLADGIDTFYLFISGVVKGSLESYLRIIGG
jgi:Fic family protein